MDLGHNGRFHSQKCFEARSNIIFILVRKSVVVQIRLCAWPVHAPASFSARLVDSSSVWLATITGNEGQSQLYQKEKPFALVALSPTFSSEDHWNKTRRLAALRLPVCGTRLSTCDFQHVSSYGSYNPTGRDGALGIPQSELGLRTTAMLHERLPHKAFFGRGLGNQTLDFGRVFGESHS